MSVSTKYTTSGRGDPDQVVIHLSEGQEDQVMFSLSSNSLDVKETAVAAGDSIDTLSESLILIPSHANELNKTSYSMSDLDEIKNKNSSRKNYKKKLTAINQTLQKIANPFQRKQNYSVRVINKNGQANTNLINIRRRKYIVDLFNTIIDSNWKVILLIFIISFLVSWLAFALIWHAMSHECVNNMSTSFIDSVLFSIETQQTIGYGSRFLTKECGLKGTIVLMLQCCFSVILESLMGGIVFAKLSKPKKRTETIIFSKSAVIATRDDILCLMCRIGDMRRSHLISAYVRMYLIRQRVTKEGEVIPFNAQELHLANNPKSSDRLLFMPSIVEHRIDSTSPLYNLIDYENQSGSSKQARQRQFKYNDFEIVVILEGTVESTGQSIQARSSYRPEEILWNQVFEPLTVQLHSNPGAKATVDFSKFNNTKPISSLSVLDTDELKKYLITPIQQKTTSRKAKKKQQPTASVKITSPISCSSKIYYETTPSNKTETFLCKNATAHVPSKPYSINRRLNRLKQNFKLRYVHSKENRQLP